MGGPFRCVQKRRQISRLGFYALYIESTRKGMSMKNLIKRLLKLFNFTLPASLSGYRFKIPIYSGIGVQNVRVSEIWMVGLLKSLNKFRTIDSLIDVGVNIGQTYMKYKNINSSGMYLGFEPNPICVHYTRKLQLINNDTKSLVIPVALSSKNCLLSFYADEDDSSDATTVDQLRDRTSSILSYIVPSYSFDYLQNQFSIKGNTIIKIDVEGGESEVISGMKEFIKKHKPIILCEVLHSDSEQKIKLDHERNAQLACTIKTLDYEIFRIIKSDNFEQFIGFKSVSEFSEGVWDPEKSPKVCDYLFVHTSHTKEVISFFVSA